MSPAYGTEFRTVSPLRGISGQGGGVDPVGVRGVIGEGENAREREKYVEKTKRTTYIDKVEDGGVGRGSVLEKVGPSAHVGSLMSSRMWGGKSGGGGYSGAKKNCFTYIENDDGVVGPLDADLTVLRVGEMVEKEFEQGVAFFFFEADDAFRI